MSDVMSGVLVSVAICSPWILFFVYTSWLIRILRRTEKDRIELIEKYEPWQLDFRLHPPGCDHLDMEFEK